jgi:hypothetical protein
MQDPSLYTYWREGYDYRISDLAEELLPRIPKYIVSNLSNYLE